MSFVKTKAVGVAATTGCLDGANVPDRYVSPFYTDNVSKSMFLEGAVWVDWTTAGFGLTQSATVAVNTSPPYLAYRKLGKSIKLQGIVVVTGTGTAANPVQIQVPYPIRQLSGTPLRPIGDGIIFDASATAYWKGYAVPVSATSVQFVNTASQSANFLGVTDFTAALAAGDTVAVDIEYETP